MAADGGVSIISLPTEYYSVATTLREPHRRPRRSRRLRKQDFQFHKLTIAKLMLSCALITFDSLAVYILTKWKLSSKDTFRCEMGMGLVVGLIGVAVELVASFQGAAKHKKVHKYLRTACFAARICVCIADVLLIFLASFCLFDATDRLRNKYIYQYVSRQLRFDPAVVERGKGRAVMEIVFASNLILLLIASAHCKDFRIC